MSVKVLHVVYVFLARLAPYIIDLSHLVRVV